MKRVAVVVRNPSDLIDVKKQLGDFVYDETNPDFVVSLGGDGTYLVSENLYPGVPKLIIRKGSSTCVKCHEGDIYPLLSNILKGNFAIEENIKLEADVNNNILLCTNDFVVRNKFPTHALRFFLTVNGKRVNDIVIGDGIVAATPFGSTAYFQSITRKTFTHGIGIAFNNTTKHFQHLILDEDTKVSIEITRGDAVLVADNNPEIIDLIEGQTVVIRKAKEKAKVIRINN